MDDNLRIKEYVVTGDAGTAVKLTSRVGYVWLLQHAVITTDDPADAGDLAVLYTGRENYDSVLAAADLAAMASGTYATFTFNGAIEIQEGSVVATVETGAGQTCLRIFVTEVLITSLRPDKQPGVNRQLLADENEPIYR